MRTWIVILAVLMVVPAVGAAASIVVPRVPEQLVEGHTVFSVIEVRRNTTNASEEFAAAVAVLVVEYNAVRNVNRFPGVLWFNDQYLVNPEAVVANNVDWRYPCTGAVLAVNAGDSLATPATTYATYVESYFITDPNDHVWDVDLWSDGLVAPTYLWSAAILNNNAGRNTPDDGISDCPAYVDDSSQGAQNTKEYNAVLYFRLQHLDVAGANKDHGNDGLNSPGDIDGCHPHGTAADTGDQAPFPTSPGGNGLGPWPCPLGNDNAEGNSHLFQPALPINHNGVVVGYDGYNNHGGSCDLTITTDVDCHATRNVDILFSAFPNPVARSYYIVDVVGSTAPFHCHQDAATKELCGEVDPVPYP